MEILFIIVMVFFFLEVLFNKAIRMEILDYSYTNQLALAHTHGSRNSTGIDIFCFNSSQKIPGKKIEQDSYRDQYSNTASGLDGLTPISHSNRAFDNNSALKNIFPKGSRLPLNHFDKLWISKVEKILRSEVDNSQFNNKWLADRLSISERQLQRRLKEITGLSPNLFFREIKMETALDLLSTGRYSTVSQIAYRVGFECPRYFAKIFRKKYGQNVRELLKKSSL